MIPKAWIAAASLILSSCIHTQLTENTLQTASTVEELRVRQLLNNISDAIDVEDRVPSLVVVNSGQSQTNISGMAGAVLPSMNFASRLRTLNVNATNGWTDFWSLSPVADPQDLQNLRALYRLLYTTDAGIAQIIKDTAVVYGLKQVSKCGIAGSPPTITNPEIAMTNYLVALDAFTPTPLDSSPAPDTRTAPPAPRPVSAGKPSGRPGSNNELAKRSVPRAASNEDFGNCYGKKPTGVIASLAEKYGLQYPNFHEVFTHLRNGLSVNCRRYQINTNSDGSGNFFSNTLFTRWLYWKTKTGEWQPEMPKVPITPSMSLGSFGENSREFWTPVTACGSDFIILAINATANSHAAALASPKGGTTPGNQ